MSLISKLISSMRWKSDIARRKFDIDLGNVCEFLNFGDSIDIDVYKESGIVVVHNVFSQTEIDFYIKSLDEELLKDKYQDIYGEDKYWLSNIANIEKLHSILYHEKLLSVIESLVGQDRKFVGHDSISFNYSVPGHHDDQNTHNKFLKGESYPEDFSTCRVLFYLSPKTSLPQRFGFVPGSHLRDKPEIDYNHSKANTCWVDVSHGSVIFFDPRLVHTSSALSHTKRMIVSTYDNETSYTKDIFFLTSDSRKQGTTSKESDFWKKMEKYNLKPSFIEEN